MARRFAPRRFAIVAVVAVALSIFAVSDKASAVPPKRPIPQNRPPGQENVGPVVEAGNHFAFDLYERLRTNPGNLFFSPASISLALAMTYAGAAENTEAEMAKTLHLQMPKTQLNAEMRALLASWNSADKKQGYRLDVANRLWGQERFHFLDDYLRVTREDYGAELARLDFNQPEAARETINKWVEDKTQQKIKNLIPSPSAVTDARLVLTNAVYFKGDWRDQFDKGRTQEEDFHIAATQDIKAPLMHQQHRYRYAEAEGLQLLELPYGDGSLAMVVLLPEKVDGLPELERRLSAAGLEKWRAGAQSRDVIVSLPKFRTTAEFELGPVLKAMGMASPFDPSTADFSRMDGKKDLFISAVLHKAFVDVNEEGTEAAAATGVVMRVMARRRADPPAVFRADHPFVFLIRDNRTGAILFLGRVVDPTK
jgi:serpin B